MVSEAVRFVVATLDVVTKLVKSPLSAKTSPIIPTPPATCNAPVVLELLGVLPDIIVSWETVKLFCVTRLPSISTVIKLESSRM